MLNAIKRGLTRGLAVWSIVSTELLLIWYLTPFFALLTGEAK